MAYKSKNGMVTSSNPISSNVGLNILKKGGNAVDAAIATAFALCVVEPFSCGVGGVGLMNIHFQENNETTYIDFIGNVPSNIKPDIYEVDLNKSFGYTHYPSVKNNENIYGYKASVVPGHVAGLYKAHELYGKTEFSELIEPSIKLAKEGFTVEGHLSYSISSVMENMKSYPEFNQTFLKEGRPLNFTSFYPVFIADRLIQKNLSNTLDNIARNGSTNFYNGDISEMIVDQMEKHGGTITKNDLSSYQPKVIKIKPILYRGYEVFAPIQGGMIVSEALKILEQYDLERIGHNEPKTLSLISKALKYSFKDAFSVVGYPYDNKAKEVVAESYISDSLTDLDNIENQKHVKNDYSSTTHLSVIDKERNMVSLTLTLGPGPSVMIENTGIMMNATMMTCNPIPGNIDSIRPGEVPLSPMSPMLCLKDNQPLLVVGASGGRRIVSACLQIISNILDHKMGMQEAHESPRIHSEYWMKEILLDQRIPETVTKKLKERDHKTISLEETIYSYHFSNPNGILVQDDGRIEGGISPLHVGSGNRGYYGIFPIACF